MYIDKSARPAPDVTAKSRKRKKTKLQAEVSSFFYVVTRDEDESLEKNARGEVLVRIYDISFRHVKDFSLFFISQIVGHLSRVYIQPYLQRYLATGGSAL